MKRYRLFVAWVVLVLVQQACNLINLAASQPTTTATPTTAPPSPAPVTEPSFTPVEHRIGVRVVDGTGEFYDRLTGEKFIPRGANFIRLDPQEKAGAGQVITFSTFNPGFYNHDEASQVLGQMHIAGYNVVRVFIESEGVNGLGDANGLNPAFMENVVDFLRLAQKNGIYVIFVKQWLPISPRYGEIIARQCCDTFNFANAIYLSPAGVEAHRLFFKDLVQALLQRQAPLDAVFSYNVSNELYFDADQPPLSWTSGAVTLANGKVYDMANPQDKQRMMDDALIIIIDAVRQTVLELDPTALVSVGFFAPQSPNPTRPGDARLIRTYSAIWGSTADYIDLHAYPGGDLTLAQHIENYEVNGMQVKPIILGEFGAFKSAFPSIEGAAQALVDWQVESCRYGFDGWLLWTWDDDTNGEVIPGTASGGLINDALSPVNRPDPCDYGSWERKNLAQGANVQASNWLPDQPMQNAVDGLAGTQWGAGAGAPQWIEIDLGTPAKVSEIRLLVAQYPEGNTIHFLKVRSAVNPFIEAARFEQVTRDGDWLIFKPQFPLENVQILRLETAASPSWVAWKEIQVYGEK